MPALASVLRWGMPSLLHEMLLLLFHNRPQLAARVLREALHIEPPRHRRARIGSAELSEIDPVQYQADLVVILEDEAPVLGIVVEVQLTRDKDKGFVWPVYVTNLRARLEPVPEWVFEHVRRWIALRNEAQAELISRQLAVRFGPLTDKAQAQIKAASYTELDAIGERLLTAATLEEALAPTSSSA